MKRYGFVGATAHWLAVAGIMIGLHAASIARVEAAPIFFGSNGYEYIPVSNPFTGTNNSWATANAAAAARVYDGVNGHLATITSQAENDALFGIIQGLGAPPQGFAGAWLGGKYPEGWLVGPESGNPFGYTNWPPGGADPNNNGYVYMSIGTTTAPSYWLDDSDVGGGVGLPHPLNDPVIGYFVEYEGVAPIPAPSTAALLSVGLAFVGWLGWRRRRALRR